MRTVTSLVWLLIIGAVLILILGIGVIFNLTAQAQADDSCSSSVLIRAGLQKAGWDGGEITCQTEVQELTGNQEEMKDQLVTAHRRCKAQFATALQNDILSGTDTYCHVCGIYNKTGGGTIEGLGEALEPIQTSGRELRAGDSQQIHLDASTPRIDDELDFDDAIAIIFFQDRTEDFHLLTLLATKELSTASLGAGGGVALAVSVFSGGTAVLLGAVAAAVGGVAGYVTGQILEGPDSTTYSGIVIRSYEPEIFEALNCQRMN